MNSKRLVVFLVLGTEFLTSGPQRYSRDDVFELHLVVPVELITQWLTGSGHFNTWGTHDKGGNCSMGLVDCPINAQFHGKCELSKI